MDYDATDVANAVRERLGEKLKVVVDSYSPREMKRRKAEGLFEYAEPRTVFEPPKAESRADRYIKRQGLKELDIS